MLLAVGYDNSVGEVKTSGNQGSCMCVDFLGTV